MIRARSIIRQIALIGILTFSGACAHADGGRLRVSEQAGPWRVTVFTSPTPLCAGAIDVSVLVQWADSNEVAQDITVDVEARHLESGRMIRERAAEAHATNKLLQAAACRLPVAGRWQFSVTASGPQVAACSVNFAADVATARYVAPELAFWIGWPMVPAAVFVMHQVLKRRKATMPS